MAAAEGQTDDRQTAADKEMGRKAGKILTGLFGLAFLIYAGLDLAGAFDTLAERAVAALNRGVQHYNKGELDEAKAAYDEAVRLDPDQFRAYYYRGMLAERRGDRDAAIADYGEAIRAEPRLKRPDVYARLKDDLELPKIHMRRVDLLVAKGDVAAAVAELDEADRLDPKRVHMVLRRGSLRLAQGDVAAAMADFDESIRRIPSNAAGWLERGKIKLFLDDEPKAAAEDLAVAMREAFGYRGYRAILDAGAKAFGVPENKEPMLYDERPFVPEGYHLMIWLHMARARAGEADAEELAKNVEELAQPVWRELMWRAMWNGSDGKQEVRKIVLGVWPGPVVALLTGQASPDEVRAAAAAGEDEGARRVRACDADFYLAAYSLEKGEREEARRLYQAAAETCPPGTVGAFAAKPELARLAP
ncbi:MAG TPA: tetratricopeptide repeat protein [Beijerinckiaceae bacterium]|jgi:tetratricopeptide (TPR) repeat protein